MHEQGNEHSAKDRQTGKGMNSTKGQTNGQWRTHTAELGLRTRRPRGTGLPQKKHTSSLSSDPVTLQETLALEALGPHL